MIQIVAAAASALACAGTALQLINLPEFPKLQRGAPFQERVDAILPVRNEATRIEAAVRALLNQPEIARVIVIDDGSSDATPAIARKLAAEDARVEIHNTAQDAQARSPKVRALITGATYTSAPWLLFIDADVVLRKGALAALLQHARDTNAHGVSAWPTLQTSSKGETLLVPALVQFLLQALPMQLARGTDPRFSAANGGLFLIAAPAYTAAGTHVVVRDAIVEDVALAAALKRSGARISLASAADIATVEGYGSFSAAAEGLGRSLYYGTSFAGCIIFAAWQTLAYVVPWIALPFAPRQAALGCIASIIARGTQAQRMNEALWPALVPWLGAAASAYAALRAAARGRRSQFVWRDRGLV